MEGRNRGLKPAGIRHRAFLPLHGEVSYLYSPSTALYVIHRQLTEGSELGNLDTCNLSCDLDASARPSCGAASFSDRPSTNPN